MTKSADNPAFDLPPGLTEDDIIDLVDGAVSPAREQVIIDALRREPALGLLVKRLRADRAMLAELPPTLPAPAGLIEAIESKLDRAAMAELVSEPEEVPGPIPMYTPPVVERGGLAAFLENRWTRTLATAASVAIVGGLGLVAARELYRQWPRVPAGSNLATGDQPASEPAGAATLANASGPAEAAPAPPDTVSPDRVTQIAAAMAPFVGPLPEEASDAQHELTAAAALKLAHQGRLVITVRSRAYPQTLRLLEQLAAAREHDTRWRSYNAATLPVELAALATPLPDETLNPPSVRPGEPPRPQVPVYTAENPAPPGIAIDHQAPSLPAAAQRRVVNKAVRLVWMPSEEKVLADLLRNLNSDQGEQTGRLRVLPWSIEPRPGLDPESVLWWSRGDDAWTVRVAVPIVVEVVE